MKRFTFSERMRKIFTAFGLGILLLAGGCYTIMYIVQPDVVAPNSAFNVKICVQLSGGYESNEYFPGYGILGILLPEGWTVKDSISYLKVSNSSNQSGYFRYSSNVVSFLKSYASVPPSGYYWWGAKSVDQINIALLDSGFINLTIFTDEKTGDFSTKFVLGDDVDWNKENYGDPFGIVDESDYLPIKVDLIENAAISRQNEEWKVYPNPATDHVAFSWNQNNGMLNLKLYEANGTCVIDREIRSNETVQLDRFSEGIYLYQLLDKKQVLKAGKLIIQ